LLLVGALCAHAETDDNTIRATTTIETGDLGGTFFGQRPDPARIRRYFIAAEPEQWDFAPSGRDEMCGRPLSPAVEASRVASKLRYHQYTDATFRARAMPTHSLGILGPVLRGVVGDFLVVTFLNRTDQSLSIHPHGVRYDKDSEGAYYRPSPGRGAAVAPGAMFTYVWQLDEDSGPRADEPSSKGWLYHSHVSGDDEINAGLVGCILVTDPARARPDGTPRDVDRELATLFMVFDESGLGAAAKEAAEYASLPGGNGAFVKSFAQVQELTELGSRYAINGCVFGNLRGLEMNEGERVRWYVFGLGSERDFHSAHWHGVRVAEDGRRRTDVVELLPATMKVVDMVAQNPGTWMLHCHVAEHMTEGMFAPFTIHGKDTVGVSRAPHEAFLGLPEGSPSLRITRAFATLAPAPGMAEECRIALKGVATTFEAYNVFRQSIHVQLGGRAIDLQTGSDGAAQNTDASWRVKNADRYGVVYGSALEFALELRGAGWREELQRLGLTTTAADRERTLRVPLTIALGDARHETTIELECTAKTKTE
jgi:hypothetical protein